MDTHAVFTRPALAVSAVSPTRKSLVHPLTILYVPNTTKEQSLNDPETTWQQLIDAVSALETKTTHDERDHVVMKNCLARLNLVQPFDWMQWQELPLSDVDIERLDVHGCVRHITRLVRADRFCENLLVGWIQGGDFRRLCEAARRQAEGRRAPSLPKAA